MKKRVSNESDKKEATYILLAVTCVVILILCFLIYYVYRSRGNMRSITLTENGIVNEELKTDFGTLPPGESKEYTLHFECKDAGTYQFYFVYETTEPSPLAGYVTVELNNGAENKTSGNLGELLAGETLTTVHTFAQSKTTSLTVRYVMANDLGDDAQGANLNFNLNLTVKKIG